MLAQENNTDLNNIGSPTIKAKESSIPWDFFIFTYVCTWFFWIGAYVIAGNSDPISTLVDAPPLMLLFILLGGMGPFIAAMTLTIRKQGKQGLIVLWKSGWNVKIGWQWLLFIIVFIPLTRILSLSIAGSGVSFDAFNQPLTLVIGAVFLYLLGGPLTEEYGWRGYALPRLLEKFSSVNATIILGLFWLFWHLPLFFIPGTSQQTFIPFMPFALNLMAIAIIMTWLFIKTGGSVFAAIAFHFFVNWTPSVIVSQSGEISWGFPENIAVVIQCVVALLLLPQIINLTKERVST